MSQINWTDEQNNVINTHGKDILVAAGAGSGKTAVLVERIIKKVTDSENPIDIDKFLIVTFTKAAAAQMREKIREKLYEKARKNSKDENLKRQLSLVHTANISTIDSFAKKVVSTNFEKLDIDPNFRLMETEESDLLLEDCIREVLDEKFEEDDKKFLEAMEQLAQGEPTVEIVDKVSAIVKKAKNQEYPIKWLENAIDKNSINSVSDFEQRPFVKRIIDEFETYKDFYDDLWSSIEGVEKEDAPTPKTLETVEKIRTIALKLDAANSYSEYRDAILMLGNTALIRQNDGAYNDFKDQHRNLRAYVAKFVGDKKPKYFPSVEEAIDDVNRSQKTANVLIDIALQAMEKCMKEKKRICAFDFSDVAHFAIDVLCVEGEDGPVASPTAEKMAKDFYEILIDEYQDSNYIQEYMLYALARGQNINNVFMVGDIKQSIYRFRSAEPEIFLGKFNDFEQENDEHKRIILGKNFRSRPEVIDFTNFIFEELMIKEVGDINYKDKQQLSLGAENYDLSLNKDKEDNKTEILCLPCNGVNRHEVEANLIAKRIINMTDENTGLKISADDENKRPVRYSDIVILTRSPKNVVDTYIRVLEEYGIPVYGEKRDGFYESTEIKIIIDFLSVIDNPLQDVPLAGVLTSAFYDFDESDLGHIRLIDKNTTLYQAILRYSDEGQDEKLKEKVNSFLKSFNDYRDRVKYMSVYEFINYFLDCSHFDQYARSLPAGYRRSLNIGMLKEIAYKYENSSYRSLFNFVRFVNKNIANNKEIGEASNVHEDDDVVRIMSIHGSKGLEYPVVIISNAAGSGGGGSHNCLINSAGDIGLDVLDNENKTKTDTLLSRYINATEQEQVTAEELRLLYVAMTRAKEKLIIIAAKVGKQIKDDDFKPFTDANKRDKILDSSNYFQMIGPIIGKAAKEDIPEVFTIENEYKPIERDEFRLEMYPSVDLYEYVDNRKVADINDQQLESDEEITKTIKKNFKDEYRFKKEEKLRAKMSVTEIKKRLNREFVDEDAALFIQDRTTDRKPNFISKDESSELTPAEIGNVYHKIFELLDYKSDVTDEKVIEAFLDDLVGKNILSEEEKKAVQISKVIEFTKSDISGRMKNAFDKGELHREHKFLMQVDGEYTSLVQEIETDETMIVQGIIDACFLEDGEYVIVDYKTDDVDNISILEKRYRNQLKVYKHAIEQITKAKVKDTIIYSVALDDEKSVDCSVVDEKEN